MSVILISAVFLRSHHPIHLESSLLQIIAAICIFLFTSIPSVCEELVSGVNKFCSPRVIRWWQADNVGPCRNLCVLQPIDLPSLQIYAADKNLCLSN